VDRVDAPKSALRAAFRKVSLEKHPDKAGKTYVVLRFCILSNTLVLTH
jgi:hypothetical protein